MVKKIVVSLVIVIAAVWLVMTLGAKSRKNTVRAHEWPMGLGRLESVPGRYPKQPQTPAAAELDRLAARIPNAIPDPIADYVGKQLQRTDRTIDPAPPIVPVAAEIRALLLSGQPIRWEADIARGSRAPLPKLAMLMRTSRLLTASALERARLGDTGAWDDLRAQHTLSRELWQRPEMISALIGMAIDRNILAAARRMPLPAPAWLDEIRTFDHRKAMLAATQADTWLISAAMDEYIEANEDRKNWAHRLYIRTVVTPYNELSRADMVTRQRERAIAISKLTTCALDMPPEEAPWWNQPAQFLSANITGAWQRVFRLRPELELTEHALGMRSGSQSQCSDGQWIVTPASVKFSKAIPIGSPATIPLEITR